MPDYTPGVGWWIAWMVAALAAGLTQGGLMMMIFDEVEASLSIEERPSWQADGMRRFSAVAVRIHRQMYPQSRLRGYLIVARVSFAVLFLGPFVWSAARSLLRG